MTVRRNELAQPRRHAQEDVILPQTQYLTNVLSRGVRVQSTASPN